MLEGLPEALVVIVPAVLLGLAFGLMVKKLRGEGWRFSIRGLLFATALIVLELYLLVYVTGK